MRNTIKILILSIFALIILSLLTCVNAATASVSANKTNVTVGENVTITVNVNAAAWSISVGGAINGRVTGYNEDGVNQNASKQFTLNTSTPGTYTVLISGDVTDQSSDYSTPISSSVTVTVTAPVTTPEPPPVNNGGTTNNNNTTTPPKTNNNNTPTTKPKDNKSSNSKLSTLKIAEGIIIPEFSSGIKEYQINIPNEITKLSIEAIAEDLKASTKITGNEELQIGENVIEITVTAEDGSKTIYRIVAIRADEELGLQSLNIFYIDENGEKIPLELNPIFGSGIYEYTLKDISYKIDKLLVEAISNKEIAIVDISGNENLKEGKNEIKITLSIKSEATEGEELQENQEEKKVYTIVVNKESAPLPPAQLSITEKIKNWFNGAGRWISENLMKIEAVALLISAAALIGLTIYFVYDYKNYKKLVAQLAEINKANLMEKANVALGPEKPGTIEEIQKDEESKEEKNKEGSENQEKPKYGETDNIEEQSKREFGKGKRFR